MSRVITMSDSVTLSPSGYTSSQMSYYNSNYPISNGYADLSSTTEARIYASASTSGYVFYSFTGPDIPNNSTITAVTASVRARLSSTSSSAVGHYQLYAGNTAKGSDTTSASTTSSTISLNTGNS